MRTTVNFTPRFMTTRTTRLTSAAILACGFIATQGRAATTTFDFSGTQYADNFTETANAGAISNSGGAVVVNNVSSLAGIVTYNTPFPSANTDAFTLKIDGKFSTIPSSFGGDSFGFMTNISGGTGYMAVFRISTNGTSQADFRLFEGAKTDGSGVGLQIGSTVVLNSANLATTFASGTFYTFNLDVSVTPGSPNSISFTGSILNATSGSVIGTFTTVSDSTATLGGTTVGLRVGTQGNVNNFTTVDNFQLITSAVPEPSSFALFGGLGALGLVLSRRRIRR
jgi:hypothetical protein